MNMPAVIPDFRPIDTSGYKPATVADQTQPMLVWADIDQLVIDPRYQRDITPKGKSAIQRIANAWDWKKYQPILIAPTDGGKLAVVDGQHRAHAAAVAGLTRLPAMTVAMTLAEQAAGFTAVNRDRVAVDPLSIYRAELAAGADWAVQACAVVQAAGCRIATSNPSAVNKKPRVIYFTGLIRKMIANGEAAAITAGLTAVTESEGADDLRSYSGAWMAAWLPALATNQRFLSLDLPAIFDTLDIDDMLDRARIRARQTGGSARQMVIDQVIEALTEAKDAA